MKLCSFCNLLDATTPNEVLDIAEAVKSKPLPLPLLERDDSGSHAPSEEHEREAG